jgi:hypothetical protein
VLPDGSSLWCCVQQTAAAFHQKTRHRCSSDSVTCHMMKHLAPLLPHTPTAVCCVYSPPVPTPVLLPPWSRPDLCPTHLLLQPGVVGCQLVQLGTQLLVLQRQRAACLLATRAACRGGVGGCGKASGGGSAARAALLLALSNLGHLWDHAVVREQGRGVNRAGP